MDAVVILGAEVDRGKVAVLKLRRQRRIAADQCCRGIAVALGLENLVFVNRAELADRPINRADQRRLRQRPGAGLEGAGEKVVERQVMGDVGIQRLGHVDLVAGDKAADDFSRHFAALAGGDEAGKPGQRLLGQQVLGKDGEAVRQRHGHAGRS